MQAYDKRTGEAVAIGATVTDFRGDTATLVRLERVNMDGRDGKVAVRWLPEDTTSRSYYASVFDLQVLDQ
jgi:hypothetical protein